MNNGNNGYFGALFIIHFFYTQNEPPPPHTHTHTTTTTTTTPTTPRYVGEGFDASEAKR